MNRSSGRPVVFVFPTFLAVGGVERNTVEVIARLKDRFDFVIVTFDRLGEGHGSLHHQFAECCKAIYDLGELGSQAELPRYLKVLRDRYTPDLIWICNGSPWLAANTALIRSLFPRTAIVDQQVYDTDLGWVSLYRERNAGLLSFDRHIAINAKIRDVFVNLVGIPPSKIDLIYSVISTAKRTAALVPSREDLRRKFKLQPGIRYFASIGRLTAQKAPLDFVETIAALVKRGVKDCHFLIVGSGELSGAVDQRIAALGLDGHVTRIDYVENTFELSRAIDGIVFTSAYEGLPIALLEALSVGTPGVCTDTGDIALVFDTFGNGAILEKAGKAKDYAPSFGRFLDRYEELKTAAVARMEDVAREFSLETCESKYIGCFEAALTTRALTSAEPA